MARGWDGAGSEAARGLAYTAAGLYGLVATGGAGTVVSSTDLDDATKEAAYSLLSESKEAIEAGVEGKAKGDDAASVDEVPESEESEDRPDETGGYSELEAADLPGESDELESLEGADDATLDTGDVSDYSDRETL
jgi:hypothetical protein